MRTVSGLDVHKDSIFMCILYGQGKKTEEKFGSYHSLNKADGRCNILPFCERCMYGEYGHCLRQYGRRINEINKDTVRCEQRIDMLLQRCNVRLSNYVSRTRSRSYRKVVDSLIRGETSVDELIRLIHGRTVNRHGKSAVHDALEGCIVESDRDLLG